MEIVMDREYYCYLFVIFINKNKIFLILKKKLM